MNDWPEIYFKLADCVLNDKDFNPNYIPANHEDWTTVKEESLISMVFDKTNNDYIVYKLFNHANIKLNLVKNWLEEDKWFFSQKYINFLLLSKAFFELEKDWAKWDILESNRYDQNNRNYQYGINHFKRTAIKITCLHKFKVLLAFCEQHFFPKKTVIEVAKHLL